MSDKGNKIYYSYVNKAIATNKNKSYLLKSLSM